MIRIQIAGGTKQGKTTLAFAIEEFLKNRGFTHVFVDDPDLGPTCGRTDEFNKKCLESIANNVTIIQTRQLKRGEMP